MMQANFVRGKGDMMGVSGMLNDGYVITNPVDAFAPNDFGLYNMAGNVNEWVMDVYRETTYQDATEYNSFRGNIYSRAKKDDQGKYVINALGGIDVEWTSEDDKRDYLDGDFASLIQTDYPLDTLGALFLKGLAANTEGNGGEEEGGDEEEETEEEEGGDEEEGEEEEESEEEGGGESAAAANKKIDPTDIYAPKITKTTHVYKGGSWNDRVYWLHPSSRRYLEGNKSKSTIGFRCAMSTLGDQIPSGPTQGK